MFYTYSPHLPELARGFNLKYIPFLSLFPCTAKKRSDAQGEQRRG